MAHSESKPRSARVYGADHSPWVQAVLLGLHERGIPTRVVQVPPLAIAFDTGIFMPAVQYDDAGEWHYDSAEILADLGFSPIEDADRATLQAVFGRGAYARTDSPLGFFGGWARLRDDEPNPIVRGLRHLTRTVAPFYFFTVITSVRRRAKRPSRDAIARDFAHFDGILADGRPFLAGDRPGVVDLQLFGQIQMLASIPGEGLAVVQEDPDLRALRAWITRLQTRWTDYPHLHSGPCFEPKTAAPAESGPVGRALFWIGLGTLVLALPLSLAVTFYFIRRVTQKGLRGGPPRRV